MVIFKFPRIINREDFSHRNLEAIFQARIGTISMDDDYQFIEFKDNLTVQQKATIRTLITNMFNPASRIEELP